jgi:6-phosphogluconolactonase
MRILRPFRITTLCCAAVQASTMTAGAPAAQGQPSGTIDAWIGTSRCEKSNGIYVSRLDRQTGQLTRPELAAEIDGPGFLAMHPRGTHLYAVGELAGQPSVAAYAIVRDDQKSSLQLVNSLPIGVGRGTHVAVDPTGNTLLTAQYGAGSVAVFSLRSDGALDERTQLVQHVGGSGVVSGRQDEPHPHWVGVSPDNQFALVPDLGLDRVVIYRLDPAQARITRHGAGQSPAGGGPRHMKFHPNGQWAYVLNELSLSVTLFDYDSAAGALLPRQTIPTVPPEELAKEKFSSASEIRIHPSGQFVYAANRGHDTITVFRVGDNGELRVVEREPVRGATPRNFNLDPSGRWLLAAGQDSDTLASFEVNPQTGELAYNRSVVSVPCPICVLFTYE